MFGAVESVMGVLICGLSISFLFAVIFRHIEREAWFSPELASLLKKTE
jgi:NhaP-type Na+/H+ or K+/H+ antiporter